MNVRPFWNSFEKWWQRMGNGQYRLLDRHIFLGIPNVTPTDKCFNFLLIHAKKFINDCKLNESKIISFYIFLHYIKNQLLLEKSISTKNGNLQHFEVTFGMVLDSL